MPYVCFGCGERDSQFLVEAAAAIAAAAIAAIQKQATKAIQGKKSIKTNTHIYICIYMKFIVHMYEFMYAFI